MNLSPKLLRPAKHVEYGGMRLGHVEQVLDVGRRGLAFDPHDVPDVRVARRIVDHAVLLAARIIAGLHLSSSAAIGMPSVAAHRT